MNIDPESQLNETKEAETRDPDHWKKAFSGNAISIVVPPYIRFLQGQIALRKAHAFLESARKEALAGNARLLPIFESLNSSKASKEGNINFETFFSSTIFINLVSEVEHFFANSVSTALRLYPEKMGSQTFRLAEVIAASSNEELIDRAASTVMHQLMYEKPLDYLSGLCDILSISKVEISSLWTTFVEIKARRDLGVHNDWVVNPIYLRKLREAHHVDFPDLGTRLIPDFTYLLFAIDSCDSLIKKIANLLGEKWIPVGSKSKKNTKTDKT